MRFKEGIKIQGISPELMLGLIVANDVYRHNGQILTITSILDGKHSNTSLHYTGCAADLRISDVSKSKISIIKAQLEDSLTADFDVILEPTHIHLEYQPRFNNN